MSQVRDGKACARYQIGLMGNILFARIQYYYRVTDPYPYTGYLAYIDNGVVYECDFYTWHMNNPGNPGLLKSLTVWERESILFSEVLDKFKLDCITEEQEGLLLEAVLLLDKKIIENKVLVIKPGLPI